MTGAGARPERRRLTALIISCGAITCHAEDADRPLVLPGAQLNGFPYHSERAGRCMGVLGGAHTTRPVIDLTLRSRTGMRIMYVDDLPLSRPSRLLGYPTRRNAMRDEAHRCTSKLILSGAPSPSWSRATGERGNDGWCQESARVRQHCPLRGERTTYLLRCSSSSPSAGYST